MKKTFQIAALSVSVLSPFALAVDLPVSPEVLTGVEVDDMLAASNAASYVNLGAQLVTGFSGGLADPRVITHSLPEYSYTAGQVLIGIDGVARGETDPADSAGNVQASFQRAIDRSVRQGEAMAADPQGTLGANLFAVQSLANLASRDPESTATLVNLLAAQGAGVLGADLQGGHAGDLDSLQGWELPANELGDLSALDGLSDVDAPGLPGTVSDVAVDDLLYSGLPAAGDLSLDALGAGALNDVVGTVSGTLGGVNSTLGR